MLKFKKYLAVIMALIITLSFSSYSSAAENTSIIIDGVTYTITESVDSSGNKVIKVTDNKEINTVVNDGTYLHITSESVKGRSIKNFIIEIDYNYQGTPSVRYEVYKTSLYWNYGYYYDTAISNMFGTYWDLDSGNTYGNWHAFDKGNKTVRDLAYEFCSSVRSLDSAQWAATGASGATAGSIAAAIGSAGPTLGIGAIIGIVGAFLSGGVAVSEWVSAYNCSLDCNQIFTRIKQAL